MNVRHFPVIALSMAVFIQLLLALAKTPDSNGATLLPLLTLLVIAEFGFLLSLSGAFVAARRQLKQGFTMQGIAITLLLIALAINLLLQGIKLWPL